MIKKLIYPVILFVSFCNLIAQVTPPTLQPGEHWTKTWSLSYDYQSNGSVRYVVQDPANPLNLCAVFMGTHDSISAAGVNRYVWFSYSTDGGVTWFDAVEVNNSYTGGFPCLSLNSAGAPVVGMHQSASPTRGFVYRDFSWGAGVFVAVGNIPQTPGVYSIWPHIAVTTNGNIVYAAAPNPGFNGYYTTWNGSTWSAWTELLNTGGPSGQFSVESGPSGTAYIFGIDYNGSFTAGNRLWTSANNGITFTLQTGASAPPEFISDGTDTMFAFVDGGRDGLYKGSEIHLVYSVYANSSEALGGSNQVWFKKAKILHWSPSTGVDTVAGRYNMPNMTDTLVQVLVNPLCHPSLGLYNGILYCTYTAYLRGNKQRVDNGDSVNAGEIFLTYSNDNGNTWSTPVNLTNTPYIEEKHPSCVRNFVLAPGENIGVYYIRDMKAGGWVNVFDWGPAPVYGIYKVLNSNIVGLKPDAEVANNFALLQNYPNPFNPSTTITYHLPKDGNVSLKVYNLLGEEVATLVNSFQKKGVKEVSFDASSFASGVYFYTIITGEFRDSKKMILVK